LADSDFDPEAVYRGHPLSSRQREVVLWMARGKTYAEVAAILGVTFGSVKTHIDIARWKLGASNVAHCVAMAVACGLLPELADRKPKPRRSALDFWRVA
jgi:DNA-binding CsgD family transcriptional regulator